MMRKSILTGLLLLIVGITPSLQLDASFSARAQSRKEPSKVRSYACPMHPEVTSNRRGRCRKCGISLRLTEAPPPSATTPDGPIPTNTPGTDQTSTISSTAFPDVEVLDQNGKRLKFRSDLVKDKTVAINFIFTTCTAICPALTATFRRVQLHAVAKKIPVQLISISVDPTTDTPERLREFAAKFKAGPGWTFVTGDKTAIDSILQSMGTAVAVKTDHTPVVLIGNDRKNYWTRTYGLSSPTNLVLIISKVAGK